jgi:nucleotide-binding universal stress UspA family protein
MSAPVHAVAREAPEQREAPRQTGPCVVLGYDGSEGARAAVSWIAEVLPDAGKLVLVHACRPLHAPPSRLSTAAERCRHGRALIDELILEGDDALLERQVTAEVADEDPVTALAGAAERLRAAGIVVGASRHSRLQKALGTVTSQLLVASPVPVIVVPPPAVE